LIIFELAAAWKLKVGSWSWSSAKELKEYFTDVSEDTDIKNV